MDWKIQGSFELILYDRAGTKLVRTAELQLLGESALIDWMLAN